MDELKSMKILHVIPSLHGGGAEKFTIDLCNELSKKHDVTVCSLFDIEDDMFMVKELNTNVKLITLQKRLGFDFKVFFRLYKLINNNYDIINFHLRALVYSILPIIFKRKVYFHTIHNLAAKETSQLNRYIYKFLFHFCNVEPIAISKQVSRSIQAEYGKKFKLVINNGVEYKRATHKYQETLTEISALRETNHTKVFITIGRISPQKNHRILIGATNQLLSENEDIVLLIIGDDYTPDKNLRSELEKLANTRIHFLGMKDNIVDYLLCSDVFCLSSLFEGLPITLLEAMSLGTIPVCTPVGGIIDVIEDNIDGFLCKSVSEQSLYKRLKFVLEQDEKTMDNIKVRSVNKFKHSYNIEVTAGKYEKAYIAKKN